MPALGFEVDEAAFLPAWREVWDEVLQEIETKPVMVLRDYHADNLMVLSDRPELGLLDFQDALAGHAAYDLVSLLQDARRDVDPALEEAMIDRYAEKAGVPDRDRFRAHYEILGAQRNTKILGIFTRLWKRDGKPNYLPLQPRVWSYLERNLAHPALAPVRAWFDANVPGEKRAVRVDARYGGVTRYRRPLALRPEPDAAVPEVAMVMAAGLGKRMRPLTATRPKPLVEVAGKPLIDHCLERLRAAGVKKVVVNVHYLANSLEAHLKTHFKDLEIIISDEREQLLETGGGLVKALPLIDADPFFVVNSDNLWVDGPVDTLRLLAAALGRSTDGCAAARRAARPSALP